MNQIANKVASFLYSNTLWIFSAAILIMSMILMVDTTDRTLINFSNYLYISSTLALLFSPVLLYSLFREKLSKRLSKVAFYGLWAGGFILYPILLWASKIIYFFYDPNWEGLFIPSIGTVLLAVELGILYNQFIVTKWLPSNWIKTLKLEHSILAILLPIAITIVLSTNSFQLKVEDASALLVFPTLLLHIAQWYIAFLVYYFFYVVNHYILINKLFKNKGLIYYGFGFATTLIVFYPIASLVLQQLPIVTEIMASSVELSIFKPNNADIPLFVMVLSIPFILSYQWLKQNNDIITLEKEKSETELSLLKQQINPHFFFNTLNNLYALSITNDKRTPDVILRLSELMRYVIYKGKEGKSKLSEDIKYIEDYIELQQIRLHKKLDYRIEKNILNDQIDIPPLLFIILVENAFKHGIEPAEKDCFLHIKIDSSEDGLTFSCTNSFEERTTQKAGIGLDNLRKRLKLLFPDRHELLITEENNSYKAVLDFSFCKNLPDG